MLSTRLSPRAALRLAYACDAVIALFLLAGIVLMAANRAEAPDDNAAGLLALFGLTAIAYSVVGTAIVRRTPSNAIGWVCFAIGFFLISGMAGTEYVVRATYTAPASLPGASLVLTLSEPTPALTMGAIVVLLFLFPDGRPLNRVWRAATWAVAGLVSLGIVADLLTPKVVGVVWADRLERLGIRLPSPTGIPGFAPVGEALQLLAGIALVVGFVASIVALFLRRRRADAETRAQLRWLGYVAGATLGWIVVMLPLLAISPEDSPLGGIFWWVVTPLVAFGVPAAIGIAIVKYRLYDIDVVIRKTVVVAVVAVAVIAVYLLVVVLALSGVGSRQLLGVVILLLMVRPVLRTARSIADRVAYGKRATSYEVLTEFTSRVGETYAADDVLPRMAQILAEGTGAEASRIFVRIGGLMREAAVVGTPGSAEVTVPVLDAGEELGALAVTMPASDPMNPAKQRLVDDLARQAGLVLRNVRLIEELKASRQRLVAAQDEERRKLERNLHDGAQQQLVALAVKQRLLGNLIGRDDEMARTMVDQLASDTNDALENLRDLARGIYPPLLQDKGLVAALEAQARKAAVPTTVEGDGVGRFGQDVEAAVYFSCLEALQNVAKYAGASRASIVLSNGDGALRFSVMDDGAGFDSSSTSYGTGLQGIADRLAALGGTLVVQSEPGAGTTVTGSLTT
jgi:signal transduction histidine kinase